MSTAVVQRRHWTREEYERVIEAGGFDPEDRIELLDGDIWELTPQGSRHTGVCGMVMEALQAAFGPGFFVRVQFPLALDQDSMPEPDVAVVRGSPREHLRAQPSEALLLVEVSDSSLAHDRGRKMIAYARNNVPEYWLVDLEANVLEVYRAPAGRSFATKIVLRHGDTITPLHAPDYPIRVEDLLP